MIKNFKWLFLVALTFAACSEDDNNEPAPVVITSGSADFSKYVALGNSLTAGYTDGALFIKGQENSWSNILAGQFELAGGGEYRIPYMSDNTGGLMFGTTQILENRLIFNGTAPVRLVGTPTTQLTNTLTGQFNNMGVPGAKSFHLLAAGYGDPAGVLTGTASPYFARFATSTTTSILADAMSQSPTFFSLWIGNNDVLGYATTGGDGTNPITPVSGAPGVGFDGTYATLINTLTSNGAKGVVANIPYVTTIPFFTTIPLKPLTTSALGGGDVAVGAATIGALNAQLYGPLKQALTVFGAGDRIELLSTTEPNPLLMKDESLTNLSAQLTAAFTPSLGPAAAAFYGQVFGQARQTKEGDLVLLTTQSAIGSAPPGIPAPLDKFGITYPLQDKHILIPTEIAELKDATDGYNAIIQATATEKGLAFVNANALLTQIANGGVNSNSFTLTSALVFGNAFSLDGVHPTSRGYALIANEFAKAINATYGSNLPMVNIGTYNNLFPASL